MKRRLTMMCLLLVVVVSSITVSAQQYKYKTYPNDPFGVREYTLDNGLKVFLSVNKEEPRIQTYIAVRAGSKNDPAETTGLAHYLEHMLFKGSHQLGTTNYALEQQYISKIEDLYEAYRLFEDSTMRAGIYHLIDSLSYEASKIAIANEYDKCMTSIGSTGTNAFTSNDFTMYVENIPSNQVENWAKVQGDRFPNLVLRLFHTELEAVYEEKNIGMAQDGRRTNETMMAALYPHHPYGTQTTIGTIEHLKNPSMRNIREYHAAYYVPNNMCVSMAGDFDPDSVIRIIDKYMGSWKPGNVPEFTKVPEEPIVEPVVRTITGLDPENLTIAFRINEGNGSRDVLLAQALDHVLNNGKCGILDVNLNQKQRCLGAYAGCYSLNDYAAFMLGGRPVQGQTLEELRDLLLEQIELVKEGKFEDWLIEAAVNNLKLSQMHQVESNGSRASQMAYAFVGHRNWGDVINDINKLSKITKQDIIDFANRICKKDAYVIIYKRQGTPDPVTKVVKPAITPIEVSRENESEFLRMIKESNVKPIEPVFVDFKKDLTKGKTANGNEILYVHNDNNSTFNLDYRFEFGSRADKTIDMAADLLSYLNTSNHTAEQIKAEFYKLACNYSVGVGAETVTVSISGLSENMEKAMALVEEIIATAQPDDQALNTLVERIIKSRTDNKTNQRAAFSALNRYGIYGGAMLEDVESDAKLRSYTAKELTDALHNLFSYQHRVLYYGPLSLQEVKNSVDRIHKTPKRQLKVPTNKVYQPVATNSNQVFFLDYDAKNTYVTEYLRSEKFNIKILPTVALFNEYFGGSMNAIVFQEMREKRSLAYSASSSFSNNGRKDGYFFNAANVITQNDKLFDALDAYEELFDDMPVSQTNFEIAMQARMSAIRTARTRGRGIIFSYLNCERMGWKEPLAKMYFSTYPTLTMQDVVNFEKKHLKGQKKTYLVLGKRSDIDMKALSKYGTVHELTIDQVFGY